MKELLKNQKTNQNKHAKKYILTLLKKGDIVKCKLTGKKVTNYKHKMCKSTFCDIYHLL